MQTPSIDIRIFSEQSKISEFTNIIRTSFKTVAEEFNLTIENASTHPSFITDDKVSAHMEKGAVYFGCYLENKLIGCIALEKSPADDSTFFLERVAVLPEMRHLGIGKKLLEFADTQARRMGAETLSIAIIAESSVLRRWYENHGFSAHLEKSYDHLPFDVLFLKKSLSKPV